ncbi:hypothetical protein BDM02DRAFT_1704409 [Thelephora ganbajun]|uniref:Uncharacterized protein n=1 Tax=Thelephora ganbajun TaxID=370292 RepID=A0ACB6ZK57_THEGA|nr:hypothetical protein BDM02DRAFT_1704409 [Thelephora ganbajun]
MRGSRRREYPEKQRIRRNGPVGVNNDRTSTHPPGLSARCKTKRLGKRMPFLRHVGLLGHSVSIGGMKGGKRSSLVLKPERLASVEMELYECLPHKCRDPEPQAHPQVRETNTAGEEDEGGGGCDPGFTNPVCVGAGETTHTVVKSLSSASNRASVSTRHVARLITRVPLGIHSHITHRPALVRLDRGYCC